MMVREFRVIPVYGRFLSSTAEHSRKRNKD